MRFTIENVCFTLLEDFQSTLTLKSELVSVISTDSVTLS